MSIEHDIEKRANQKMAGIMDSLGSAWDSISGNEGTLPSGAMGAGGALLGGMAGRGLGMGPIGSGIGALLGGGMGYAGSNAINMQSSAQDNMDKALINGVSAGLMANDQTDMMQNEAISQNNAMMGQVIEGINTLGSMLQGSMGMAPGMDPAMDPAGMGGGPGMGMGLGQPGMGPGMGPGGGMMDGSGMAEMQGAPMTDQVENNGLGKQSSYLPKTFEEAVIQRASEKIAMCVSRMK